LKRVKHVTQVVFGLKRVMSVRLKGLNMLLLGLNNSNELTCL
jgi:hypothetical protein